MSRPRVKPRAGAEEADRDFHPGFLSLLLQESIGPLCRPAARAAQRGSVRRASAIGELGAVLPPVRTTAKLCRNTLTSLAFEFACGAKRPKHRMGHARYDLLRQDHQKVHAQEPCGIRPLR